jgi:Flp pilus assembly protein TadD
MDPALIESDRVFAEANQLFSEGKLKEAEKKYQWLIQNVSDNPRPYNNLGNLYARLGEKEKARTQYEKALQLNPGYLIARLNLAVLSLKHGETDEALKWLREGIKEYPDNSALHNGLGICAMRKWDNKEAVRHFQKAIDIEESKSELYNNLAYAYAESNEHLNEALKLSKEVYKKDADNAVFLDTLGWVYFKRGVFDESINYLSRALEKDPHSAKIRSHLVKVYRWMGDNEKVRGLIKDGIRLRALSGPLN